MTVTDTLPATLTLGPFTVNLHYLGPDDYNGDFIEWASNLAKSGTIVGVDVESNGHLLHDPSFRLTVASLTDGETVWIVDGSQTSALGFATEQLNLVAHNAPYDGLALRAWTGQTPKVMADSLIATLLHSPPVDPANKYGLKHLADEMGWYELTEAEAVLHAAFSDLKSGAGWAIIPPDDPRLLVYNALDALACRQLYLAVVSAMDPGPAALLALEMRLQHAWMGTTWRGLRVDRAALGAEIDRLDDELDRYARALMDLGIKNPRSQPQLTKWFSAEGAVFSEFTSKGNPSFAAEAIPSLTDSMQPDRVRKAGELIGQFNAVSGLLAKARELDDASIFDGRLHPFVNTLKARTGRMSMSEPALQNIPKGSLRRAIIADEGMVLVGADLSTVEMRMAAALSGDKKLQNAIADGLDIHNETAKAIFGPEFTKQQRHVAKTVAFATLYGGGAKAISQQAGIPIDMAAEVRGRFFDTYPGLAEFVHEIGEMRGIVTPTGRRIPAMEGRAYALTNYLIQSTSRDLLAHACLRLVEWGWGPYLWLPIHDEIILQVPEAQDAEAVSALEKAMNMVYEGVPITAEAEVIGKRWGDE